MQRVVAPELLDFDGGTPREIAASLGDLRRINRWFGGTRTTLDLLERARPQQQTLSLLDVGSGWGETALTAQRVLQARGGRLDVTLLDRRVAHLPPSPTGLRSDRHARRVAGDARALPFRDDAFDLVSCALLAHHLEPDDLVRVIDEALRVARVAVLVNDLRRSAWSLALVYAGFPLYRSRLTRHDAPASVRRAYTIAEMRALLARTRAQRVEIAPRYLFRMGVIAWKNGPTGERAK